MKNINNGEIIFVVIYILKANVLLQNNIKIQMILFVGFKILCYNTKECTIGAL